MKTTTSDLSSALGRYARACTALGLVPSTHQVVLAEGSKVNGRAYRVALRGRPVVVDGKITYPHGSGHDRPPVGDDFLGMTKTEARAALLDRAEALEHPKIAEAFEIIANLSRMSDPYAADNDDNADTLRSLIRSACDVMGVEPDFDDDEDDEDECAECANR